MSEDGVRTGEGKLRDRLKRRRTQRRDPQGRQSEAGDNASAGDETNQYDFGYGGWSITLDDMPMPEAGALYPSPTAGRAAAAAQLV